MFKYSKTIVHRVQRIVNSCTKGTIFAHCFASAQLAGECCLKKSSCATHLRVIHKILPINFTAMTSDSLNLYKIQTARYHIILESIEVHNLYESSLNHQPQGSL
uniref:Uncharacterized protein n=1 Tax=Pararge aegeria TaxID=116150 RepID=S4PVX6_9NEOP